MGGVIPFRGTGADALRYVEADRSRADDYYLGAETHGGAVRGARQLRRGDRELGA